MNKGLRRAIIAATATMTAAGVATASVIASGSAIAAYGRVTAITTVNIRSAASTTSSVLGVLYPGDHVVQVGAIANGWVPVSFKGRTAYVAADYLRGAQASENAAPSTAGATGSRFTTADLNVRSAPRTTGSVRGLLSRGTAVTLTGLVSGNWAQIQYRGERAWVSSDYLSGAKPNGGSGSASLPTATGKRKTTAALTVRTEAGRGVPGVRDIPRGAVLDVTGRTKGAIAQVLWQGQAVWVTARYLTNVSSSSNTGATGSAKPIGTQYATTTVNIRSGASTSTSVIATVGRGTAVQITGKVQTGWAQIVYLGAARWVSAQYLSKTAPSGGSSSGGNTGSGNGSSNGIDLTGSEGLANVRPSTRNIINQVAAKYNLHVFYGVRPDPYPDHPSGRAVDIMMGGSYRTDARRQFFFGIRDWLQANASSLNIEYIIFDQKIWSVARSKEGWRQMANRGGDTANHKDHIHVTVNS